MSDGGAPADTDVEMMREAIRLAEEKMASGCGGPFGAVVAMDGRVVGRGWNRVTSTNDPTAHAEIVAIRNACEAKGVFHLDGATLYSSCEPCPMCLAAAYWAHISRVFCACNRTDAADAGFADDEIYEQIALPPPGRRLPMSELLRDEGLVAFRKWKQKEDRIEY